MNKIHIVFGSCGAYEDSDYWAVVAYDSEDEAIKTQIKLNDLCEEYRKKSTSEKDKKEIKKQILSIDKDFYTDYCPTYYTYITVPYIETVNKCQVSL